VGTYHLAGLWVGLWIVGLLTVALGNLIVLIPILLNSHPNTKYGIPFPVLRPESAGTNEARRRAAPP
jgi:NCS1 family nucleobase:cation symporter-1